MTATAIRPDESITVLDAEQPEATVPEVVDRPRTISSFGRNEWAELGAAAVAGAALVEVAFQVMAWDGLIARALWWLAVFLAIYRVLVGETNGSVVAGDRMMTVVIGLCGLITVGALGWLVVFVFAKGLPMLRPSFFTETMASVGPLDDGGGALHAIVGTLQQVGLATAVAVPAAILTAVYLHEIRGRGAGVIRFFIDAMSGLPSIVAGLLVYTVWILQLGNGFSGMAASAALMILMLPTVTRTAEEILRTIPGSLREAALALGSPEWRVVTKVVLPTARSGLITAAILGVARAIGETAPLLLTSSYTTSLNTNPTDGRQASLPSFVYQLIKQPNETQIARAWTGALVLLLMVLVLFLVARVIGERGQKKRGS